MRIIAGSARGMHLFSPPDHKKTRPLTDMARGALFNIIGPDIVDAAFLDLFAGTGAVGIEALSRGAERATLVEKDPKVIKIIHKNLEKVRLQAYANVIHGDVFHYLKNVSESFDAIFVGPPQYKSLWKKSILTLDETSDCMKDDGLIILQCDPVEYETLMLKHIIPCDQRNYGNVLLTFFNKI